MKDPIDEVAPILQISDYLAILELPDTTSDFTEIQKAYKKKALKWHPDRHMQNQKTIDQAAENFRMYKKCYDKLKDAFSINGHGGAENPDFEGLKKVADQVSFIARACLAANEKNEENDDSIIELKLSCALLKIIPNSIYMLLNSETITSITRIDLSYNQLTRL